MGKKVKVSLFRLPSKFEALLKNWYYCRRVRILIEEGPTHDSIGRNIKVKKWAHLIMEEEIWAELQKVAPKSLEIMRIAPWVEEIKKWDEI